MTDESPPQHPQAADLPMQAPHRFVIRHGANPGPIRLMVKRSHTAGRVPSAGMLVRGELAYNMADQVVYAGMAGGDVGAMRAQPGAAHARIGDAVLDLATGELVIQLDSSLFPLIEPAVALVARSEAV